MQDLAYSAVLAVRLFIIPSVTPVKLVDFLNGGNVAWEYLVVEEQGWRKPLSTKMLGNRPFRQEQEQDYESCFLRCPQ